MAEHRGTAQSGSAVMARPWRRRGLIERLAISCSVVLLALGLVLTFSYVRMEVAQHDENSAARLKSDLSMLTSALEGYSIAMDTGSVAAFLAAFAQRPGVELVTWNDRTGNAIAFRGGSINSAAPAWFEAWVGLLVNAGTSDIVVGATHHGQVSLRLSPVQAINQIWDFAATGVLLLFTGFGVLLVVTLFTVEHGLRPLVRLASAAGRFGQGELDVRVIVGGAPEVVSSIRAFNCMADRVGGVLDSLRDSEAKSRRLAMIVEQSSESIMTCDLDMAVTSWNKGAERLFGWTAPEAVGRSVRELQFRGLSDSAHTRMLAHLRSAKHWAGEGTRVTKSGATLHVWATHAPLLDESGSLVGTIAIARDITALKEAQRALAHANEALEARVHERTAEVRRTETLLRVVMDAMPGVVVFQDAELRYQVFNRQMEEWLQMDAETIRGKTPSEVTSEENYLIVQPHLEQALGGREVQFEWQYRLPDGTVRDVDTTLVPVLAASGEFTGIASFSMDISERKRAAAALHVSEARSRVLTAMVEQSTDVILARDLDGSVTYWNHGAEQVYGFSPEEAIGQPLRSLHLRKLSDEQLAAVLARVRSGKPTVFEGQRLTKAGKTIDAATSTAPLFDDAGRLAGEAIVQRDVTEAKNAERELRRAKESAEAANRAKSEFLANMSHEIRTPLNGVLGLTELVLDTDLTAEQRADLQLVQSSGKSLMGIINDILDFSKIEAGHLQLETIAFAPADSIADMVKVLAPRAHERGLELVYDAPSLPPLLLGDPGRLRQIVINLVGNAIKFTERGEIAVTVDALPAGADASAGVTLQISVRDSGIGIPKEKLATIFDAFTQADTSTTRRYGGTGLGLTISAQLVRLMGGTIRVESVPGQGSAFIFTIRCGVPSAPSVELAREPRALEGQAVLVVEDNDHYREVLLRLLAGWGMAPAAAADGETALEMLSQAHEAGQPYPLMLLDVQLPGIDGFAVAEQVKREPHLAGAVLVLTGAAQRGDAARCRELGVAAYLSKPVRPSELFDAMVALPSQPTAVPAPAPQLITRHSLREAGLGLSILVAEDNDVNQRLARRVLQKLGHRALIANNGREALEALAGEAFDLVLMDMQMPVMGGLEAAAAIRSREAASGSRLPIIALTANAMQGDRESCLAAGMDDFLTKPYSADQLDAVLRRWLPGGPVREHKPTVARSPALEPAPAPTTGGRLDVEILKGYVGDDDEAVEEFLRSYLESSAQAADKLRQACRDRHADAFAGVSHQLKSTARIVGAIELGELCAHLEGAGNALDWPVIDAAMPRLQCLIAGASADADAWLSETWARVTTPNE